MRRRRRKKVEKAPQADPTDGVWIQANINANGNVTWRSNISTSQHASYFEVMRDLFSKFGMARLKHDNQNRTRDFTGAMNTVPKQFNSRRVNRRFGVWFRVSTPPLDRAYTAWKLASGGGVMEFVPSQTDPNKQYVIAEVNGELTCSCPAFKFRKSGKNDVCKHIRAYVGAA